jgi:hypothetical protein
MSAMGHWRRRRAKPMHFRLLRKRTTSRHLGSPLCAGRGVLQPIETQMRCFAPRRNPDRAVPAETPAKPFWTDIANDQCADGWHLRLLRARPERPRRRATDERDEFAALHSITSSARVSSDSGTSIPSALAVFILMTNAKWVGCSTGRSAGWAPLRILSTYAAALRKRSAYLAE